MEGSNRLNPFYSMFGSLNLLAGACHTDQGTSYLSNHCITRAFDMLYGLRSWYWRQELEKKKRYVMIFPSKFLRFSCYIFLLSCANSSITFDYIQSRNDRLSLIEKSFYNLATFNRFESKLNCMTIAIVILLRITAAIKVHCSCFTI